MAMTITPTGLGKVAQETLDLLASMEIDIAGAPLGLAFTDASRIDDTITVSALVLPAAAGLITEVRLIDTAAAVFASRAENIDKPAGKYLLIGFSYKVTEVAV